MRLCFLIAILPLSSLATQASDCPSFGAPSEGYDKFTVCYIRNEGGISWLEASLACGSFGAHLVFPYNRRELDLILRLKYSMTKSMYPNLAQARSEELLLHLNGRKQTDSEDVVVEFNWNKRSAVDVPAIRTHPIRGYNRKVTGVWYNESALGRPLNVTAGCAAHVTSERDVSSDYLPVTWVNCKLAKATLAFCRRGRGAGSCNFPVDLLSSPEHTGGIGHLYFVDLMAGYLSAGYPVTLDMFLKNRSQLSSIVATDWDIGYGTALVYSCAAGWYTDENDLHPTRQYVCGASGWMREENSTCRFYDGCAADRLYRGLAEQTCSGHGYCSSTADATTTCRCLLGHSGENCEHKLDACASNPCGSLGNCHNLGSDYYCVCHGSYSVDLRSCDIPINECALLNPCANGGTCEERDVGYRCRCPLIVKTDGENVQLADGNFAKWIGPLCDIDPADDCSSNPCAAGSLCTDYVGYFSCVCQGIRTGKYCEGLVVDAVSIYGAGLSVVIGYSMFFAAFTLSCMLCTKTRKSEVSRGTYATEDMIIARYHASVESEKEELMKYLGSDGSAAGGTATAQPAASALALSPTRSTLLPRSAHVSRNPSRVAETFAPTTPAGGDTPQAEQAVNPLHLTAAIATLMRIVPRGAPTAVQQSSADSESSSSAATLTAPQPSPPVTAVLRAPEGAAPPAPIKGSPAAATQDRPTAAAIAAKKRKPSAPARLEVARKQKTVLAAAAAAAAGLKGPRKPPPKRQGRR